MAKATEFAEELKTYYLIDQMWQIDTKNKIIYSPFNELREWRTKQEDNYGNEPKKVTFISWIYETDSLEEIEFLDHWNEAVWARWYKLSNWRKFWNDWIHRIQAEKPKDKKKEVVVEEKEVFVQTIPRQVAEMMANAHLLKLCEEWWNPVKAWSTKEEILKVLEDGKHLT